jgi:magnesium chelatase family protein
VRAYRARLSGPLVDRLDLHISLRAVDVMSLQQKAGGERSEAVRARVERTRQLQRARHAAKESSVAANAHLSASDVERVCALDERGKSLIADAVRRLGLSARAYGKVLRVARTIADLEGATAIGVEHLAEAISARVLDRGDLAPSADAA